MAVKLATDRDYYNEITKIIKDRRHLLFNRYQVVEEWNSFFRKALGYVTINEDLVYNNFIQTTNKKTISDLLIWNPTNIKYNLALGILSMNKGDFSEAEKRFRYCYYLWNNNVCFEKIQWFERNVFIYYLFNYI